MTVLGALLLVAQAAGDWTATPAAPTVGDTVVLTRALPGATTARVRPLAGTGTMEVLAEPTIAPARGGVLIRYAVALFAPGEHSLAMPDVDVLRPDGVAETIAGDTARVTIASVLPADDSLPAPRPSLGPLPRPARRIAPLLVFVALALASGATWWGVRRRRGPRPARDPMPAPTAFPPLDRWMAAGEARAVAAVASDRLRRAIARAEPAAHAALVEEECLAVLRDRRPTWPLGDLAETLAGLERARYAPLIPADLLELARQADEIMTAIAHDR